MEARDFRSIGRAAQEELRRRALFLIEQQGLSQAEAGQVVGVQRQTVNIWLQRYRTQGEDGVLDGRRVSPRRGKGLLTAAEAGQVKRWIGVISWFCRAKTAPISRSEKAVCMRKNAYVHKILVKTWADTIKGNANSSLPD